ncbi:VanZ family protein [Streptococcus catagoni]|uniref:VanZ family protein n=1 Tax=Streptococcus catagoni TaxID=2654874 RepID=UPI0014098C93|nr:VanZ family protein [Streptococcus catagoni]
MFKCTNPAFLSKRQLIAVKLLAVLYLLAIVIMCFSPSPHFFKGVETPNILFVGRLRLLLVPFNSLVGLKEVHSVYAMTWIFCQNLLNIFLLFPLVSLIHLLTDKWHGYKKSFYLGLSISAFIEVTQLLLDILIDANRVFEIDDLWTNSLGAVLAYSAYLFLVKKILKRH